MRLHIGDYHDQHKTLSQKEVKKKTLYLFIISLTPEGHHKSPLASFFVLLQKPNPLLSPGHPSASRIWYKNLLERRR